MIRTAPQHTPVITRKQALYVISRYLKFIPKRIRKDVLNDMVVLELLAIENRDKMRIINIKKSEDITERVFQEELEKSWWVWLL